jgi:hypothetical protein
MSEPRSDHSLRRFSGWLLLLVGGLVATLCGLCTAVFFVAGLIPHGDASFTRLSLLIGGIPTAIGVGLFLAGRALLRPTERR